MVRPVSVSIVIPTTLRRATVDEAVTAALGAVSPAGGEVLVMANGPADGRRRLDVRSPCLRVLESPGASASAARNLGIREAANDVVLFTDDDCVASERWCHAMTERLRNGAVATATPLRMRRDGPVTTFLDYQAVYHPPPIDASTVRYAVGASTGMRRDLVATRFDHRLFSGDDAEFGAQIREAGGEIVLVEEAPPPLHVMPEEIDSITGRFWRYGRGNAIRFLELERSSVSVPHATEFYASLIEDRPAVQRRFEEIADDGARDQFATFDLMLVASFLTGYLSEAGRILGREIVRADPKALAAGWIEIAGRLGSEQHGVEDWDGLPVDFARWETSRVGRRPPLAKRVAENLARHAPLVEPVGHDPDLDSWAGPGAHRAERIWASANRIWEELRSGELEPKVGAISRRLRRDGIPFREGAQMVETIAQGPLRITGEPASRTPSPA
jgi:glycosyltransferase involved in cell wall biosynthesis